MNLLVILLALLLVLPSTQTADDFQVRNLYYNSGDNICFYGDWIWVIVDVGTEVSTHLVRTLAGCTEPYFGPRQVIPPRSWSYISNQFTLVMQFHDETNYVHKNLKLIKILQKTTVNNPISYGGQDYQCVIIGDGTEQHYGFLPPGNATVYLKCNRAEQEISPTNIRTNK